MQTRKINLQYFASVSKCYRSRGDNSRRSYVSCWRKLIQYVEPTAE